MATESPPYISLNERLRRARLAQDLSLRDLVKRCEEAGERINHGSISRYEKGEYRPKRRRLRVLAAALDIPFDDIDPLNENRQESA